MESTSMEIMIILHLQHAECLCLTPVASEVKHGEQQQHEMEGKRKNES